MIILFTIKFTDLIAYHHPIHLIATLRSKVLGRLYIRKYEPQYHYQHLKYWTPEVMNGQ